MIQYKTKGLTRELLIKYRDDYLSQEDIAKRYRVSSQTIGYFSKKWFDEFTSRDNNVLNVDGNEFTISVREVKVEV